MDPKPTPHPRGSVTSPLRPFGDAYWKRVDRSRYGQTGAECCLCGRVIRGRPRYFIAIDLGDLTLYPLSVKDTELFHDFSIEAVGSVCARQLRDLNVLRKPAEGVA